MTSRRLDGKYVASTSTLLFLFVQLHLQIVIIHTAAESVVQVHTHVGGEAVLPCQLDPPINAAEMTVEWSRPDLDPQYVHVHRDGRELSVVKYPSYRGRTSLSEEGMKTGNISLRLSGVIESDEGYYTCRVSPLKKSKTTQLIVGVSRVIGPSQPVVAVAGDDVILPCHLDPAVSAVDMTVEWTRPGLNQHVHLYRDGREMVHQISSTYKGRTRLFADQQGTGDVSLKLSRVRHSDAGRYRCFVVTLGRETVIELKVELPTVRAVAGEDAVLPCRPDPRASLREVTVEWSRPDLAPRSGVHAVRDGRELFAEKNPAYKGRTAVFAEEFQRGNVSLKLFNLKRSDEGLYRCFIPSLKTESVVQLIVGSASTPKISIMGMQDSGVALMCEAKSWYPEPRLEWLDNQGNVLLAKPSETHEEPDGLCTVRSRVIVKRTVSIRYTRCICRVQQYYINQTRETDIHVPDDFFPKRNWSDWGEGFGVAIAVVALVCIICHPIVFKCSVIHQLKHGYIVKMADVCDASEGLRKHKYACSAPGESTDMCMSANEPRNAG